MTETMLFCSGSETEGTNRMETKDAEGYQMVKEIIRVGQEPDGGYTDYVFPKEGGDGVLSEALLQQGI